MFIVDCSYCYYLFNLGLMSIFHSNLTLNNLIGIPNNNKLYFIIILAINNKQAMTI